MQCFKCNGEMDKKGVVTLETNGETEECTRYECNECGKEVWVNQDGYLYN